MILESSPGYPDGVSCDLCGTEARSDFTYYSIDIREVTVSNGHSVNRDLSNLPIIFSLDRCKQCMVDMANLIKINFVPTSTGVNCDLCGLEMRGNFIFYYMTISEVVVSMSSGMAVCGVCNKPLSSISGPCKCGATKPIRVALQKVDDKYLQIACCQRDYDVYVEAAKNIRKRGM